MTVARKSLSTKWQLILFLFVGGVNTLFSYGVYAFFIFIGLPYYLAVLLATCIGVLFNFMTTGRIVFKNSNSTLIFKFMGVYAFLYFLNIGMLKILLFFSDNLYLNGLITVFPLAVLSFVMNKFLVFRERYETH